MSGNTLSQLLQAIDVIATEIGGSFNEYESLFPEFKKSVATDFNQWYETEAEIRAKLDMIHHNLLNKLKG